MGHLEEIYGRLSALADILRSDVANAISGVGDSVQEAAGTLGEVITKLEDCAARANDAAESCGDVLDEVAQINDGSHSQTLADVTSQLAETKSAIAVLAGSAIGQTTAIGEAQSLAQGAVDEVDDLTNQLSGIAETLESWRVS